VVPLDVGFVEIVSVFPPARIACAGNFVSYAVYAVVVAPSVADEVNRAILNTCDVPLLKSKVPSSTPTLNDVTIACVIAISLSS
jgi:hypothetical protein